MQHHGPGELVAMIEPNGNRLRARASQSVVMFSVIKLVAPGHALGELAGRTPSNRTGEGDRSLKRTWGLLRFAGHNLRLAVTGSWT